MGIAGKAGNTGVVYGIAVNSPNDVKKLDSKRERAVSDQTTKLGGRAL